jgi:glycosyltransferase involved in cell wall biosynthesis
VDGEARSIVEASEGGVFVPPENVGAMRDAIVALAADQGRCREMGARGRRYVMGAFDRRKLADAYLRVLEDVRTTKGGTSEPQ